MNKCHKCGVTLHVKQNVCPICHNKITLEVEDSIYPEVKNTYRSYKLFFRITLLLSLCGIAFSLLINYLTSPHLSWSIFVILGIVSFWLTFITGINKKNNFMKKIFLEIILIIILSFLWDKYTGFHKWSLTYVLPFLCISYTITFLILRLFTNKTTKDDIIHTYLNSLIGLIPLYFIIKNNIHVLWPSYISVFTSIFALIFLFVFNRKTLGNEIERRMHF